MNRGNDVNSVLVTKGNAALATAASTVDSLAVGQLGVFDANTHLAFGATVPAGTRGIYLAVGVDTNEGSTLNDIRQSAGQYIQTKGISGLTYKPHTAGRPMIVKVGDFAATSETDYGIRVEFRNAQINRIQGFNQFSKAYVVRTACCAGCADGTVSAIDSNLLTQLLIAEINADEAGLVIAQAIARQALTIVTHGTSADYAQGAVVSAADVEALITFNLTALAADKVYTDLKLTSVPLAIGTWCQVNLGYHKLLETVLLVSLVEGFGCSGAVTISQYPVYEEGSGTNIQQKEYHASGWQGSGPYKLSEVTGTAKGNIKYLAAKSSTYDQFILEYAFASESGWLDYNSILSTIIAIPEADTVTRNAVATMFNSFLASQGFETLVDDAAAANTNPAVVEGEVAAVATDGIA